MSENPLINKLRLQPNQRILLLNAEPAWVTFFAGPYDVDTKAHGTYDVILLFAPDVASLNRLIPGARKAIREDGTLWAAFPKGSSGQQTDLTRDKGWECLSADEWKYHNLIAVDKTWSAFGLQPITEPETGGPAKKAVIEIPNQPKNLNPFIDVVKREIKLPEDLGLALSENKEALVFFETLSFTNRKEYVEWVTSARREETRQRRILETVAKLDKGLKNPADKGN